MRIVFLGSGEFGLPTLAGLCERHEVPLVISQPDRPAGRKRVLTPTPIAAWADQQGLPTIKPTNVNESAILDQVRSAKPDAMVIVAFGQYLKQSLVTIPGYGAMNLHASLLPRWRGASPINSAVLAGDTVTGNTVIRIAPKMDAGAMLGQQATPINPLETAGELHDRLSAMGPMLVGEVLERLEAGRAAETEQDDALATSAPKLSRADGYVDFNEAADVVRTRVHGLTPWPGVTVYWSPTAEGQREPIKLHRVQTVMDLQHDDAPGRLLDEHGTVACGSDGVHLLEVQPPGKRVMSFTDFANGHALQPGAMFHRGL